MRSFRFGMVVVALGFAVVSAPLRAADPFYVNLLDTGKTALERGDFAGATHALRVASFGLLDEPDLLAVGLTHLALAQAGAADQEAFDETVTRLLDIERRFSAYENASIDGETRLALEQRLVASVPYERLSQLKAFRAAARTRRDQDIRSMPPETRRPALEALIAADPNDLGWRTLLAELELTSGRAAIARDTLAALPPQHAQDPRVRCLRGRAQATLGACAAALPDLESCGAPATDADLAVEWVTCLTATRDWQQAAVVLNSLPAAWRSRKPLRTLDRETQRTLKRLAKAAPTTTATTTTTAPTAAPSGHVPTEAPTPATDAAASPPESTTTPSNAPPAIAEQTPPAAPAIPDPASSDQVEDLRARAANTTDRAGLSELFERTSTLADDHPDAVEAQFLAAEMAYRLSNWPAVVHYIQRGDTVTNRPLLQFYLAVALYETGDQAAATDAMSECLPNLAPSAFVQKYAQKILGST